MGGNNSGMAVLYQHHDPLPAMAEFALDQSGWHSRTGSMPRDLACLFAAVDFAYIQIDMTASRRTFILPDRQVLLHFCNDLCLDGPARDFTFPAPACTLLRLPHRFAIQTKKQGEPA
jgi:hypothetical protein